MLLLRVVFFVAGGAEDAPTETAGEKAVESEGCFGGAC
jgi:hypothetical protein